MIAANREKRAELCELVPNALSGTKSKAMVVATESTKADEVRQILAGRGIASIVVASDLESAFARMKAERFDLIIVDYFLPDGNGIDFMEWADDSAEVIMIGGHLGAGVRPMTEFLFSECERTSIAI